MAKIFNKISKNTFETCLFDISDTWKIFICSVYSGLHVYHVLPVLSASFEKFHHVFFILTDSYTGNQRYIYIPTLMSWYEAQAYCRLHHTDLASMRDATEESIVRGLISGYTWIGLFRDSWKWIDESNLSTVSWMPRKPNNTRWHENCGYINNSRVGDALCSDIMPFVCYSGEFQFYPVSNFIGLNFSSGIVWSCVCFCVSASRNRKKI